jgi:tetratricopeptide (TPR) repeat protein
MSGIVPPPTLAYVRSMSRLAFSQLRTALIALLLLTGSQQAPGGPDDRTSVAALLNRGDAMYRAMDNAGALSAYLEAEQRSPKDFDVLVRLTRVYNDMGRELLRKSPEAETYYRRAIEFAERMREYYPDKAETWFFLALCHGSLVPFKSLGEKLELSRDVRLNAEHSLQIDSTFVMSYVVLGIYYRGVARLSWLERTLVNGILGKNLEGTLEDSERMLQKALVLAPDNPFVHYELAWTYRSLGRNARELQQQNESRRQLERLLNPDRTP